MLEKYNPKKIRGVWNNIPFLGYMDGTFVEVEYSEDAITPHVGGQGDVSLVLNANQMATATITIIQGSPTNDLLAAQVPNSDINFMPSGDFQLTDLNGTTLVHDPNAVLSKMAKIEFGKTITGRQWKFILPKATITAGGSGS